MSNVMSLKKLRNKVSRNGFDLQEKNIFSAKVGELLPVYTREVIPGDSYEIDLQSFTRTQPVNTAAYTRIREYFDFFFVPMNLMWNQFNTFITQLNDETNHATTMYSDSIVTPTAPFMASDDVSAYLLSRCPGMGVTGDEKFIKNMFGFNRAYQSCKLLSYLNYGTWNVIYDAPNKTYQIDSPQSNVALNAFPLLAYQKIYSDYFRNSVWESNQAYTFNVDYLKDSAQLPISQLVVKPAIPHDNMFDLRYANWNKDYFMGIMPNSQYGAVTTVNTANPITYNNTRGIAQVNSSNNIYVNQNASWMSEVNAENLGFKVSKDGTSSYLELFSILQLRQAEAKQKWAEITQSQQKNYKSQVEAHFNASPENSLSERSMYLGGISSNIDITEVVNTNLSSSSSSADIAGKGVGAGRGSIKFKSDVHGVLMCIYHAVPLLDYAISGINKFNLKTKALDYAIPEYDKVGMVQVPVIELSNKKFENLTLLGYAPRYYDYKTSYDRVHGAFVHGGLDSWVAPMSDKYLTDYLTQVIQAKQGSIEYSFFKVNPHVTDPIFMASATDDYSSDQLLINSNFDVKAVRSLDYDGLPY